MASDEHADNNGKWLGWPHHTDLDDIYSMFPYARGAYTAWCFIKKKRVKRFFLSLKDVEESLSQSDKDRLRKYVSSKEGGLVLGEFIDSVLQSNSKIAHAALAILYADIDGDSFNLRFKMSACSVLASLDDEIIEAFLQLTDETFLSRRQVDKEGPYPVYMTQIDNIEGQQDVAGYSAEQEVLTLFIHELTIKGLLAPDHARSRLAGKKVELPPYGVGVMSQRYRKLLLKAKVFMEQDVELDT